MAVRKTKKCYYHKICQNGNGGCYCEKDYKCVRFLPVEGTNITHITGYIETPPNIDYSMFCDIFTNWIDSLGWQYCGIVEPCEEEK